MNKTKKQRKNVKSENRKYSRQEIKNSQGLTVAWAYHAHGVHYYPKQWMTLAKEINTYNPSSATWDDKIYLRGWITKIKKIIYYSPKRKTF